MILNSIALIFLVIWNLVQHSYIVALRKQIKETDSKNWLDTVALYSNFAGRKPLERKR